MFCLPKSKEAREFEVALRASDLPYMFIMDVPIALIWPSHQLNFDVLKAGLDELLERFPVAAGRLVRKNGQIRVSCKNSQGAALQFHQSSEKMPSPEAPSSAWTKYFVGSVHRAFRDPFNTALLGARLTTFTDGGCVLCVNVAHCVADGAGIEALLQSWSHYCGKASEQTVLMPPQEPPAPVLDRSIPKELVPQAKEHVKKYHKERASYSSVVVTGLTLIAKYKRLDALKDFKLTAADLAVLKQELSEKLEKPKWISSYEAIMSLILRSLAYADGRKSITCRCIVNIRGRSKLAPKEYFGNALTYHEVVVPNEGAPSDTAFAFHEGLRSGLGDEEKLNLPHVAAEYFVNHKNEFNHTLSRARYVRPFFLSVSDGEPVVNSWLIFNFFNMDFGLSGQAATYMRVAPTFRQHRHVHMFPSSADGDIMLRMTLPPDTMERFIAALAHFNLDKVLKEVPG